MLNLHKSPKIRVGCRHKCDFLHGWICGTFCMGGSVVPSAQPQRLTPHGWEHMGDSQVAVPFPILQRRGKKALPKLWICLSYLDAATLFKVVTVYFQQKLPFYQSLFPFFGMGLVFTSLHAVVFHGMPIDCPEMTSFILRAEWLKWLVIAMAESS